jgi:hypothetical protein
MPSSFALSQQTQFLLTERGVALARPSRVATFDRDGFAHGVGPIEPNTMVATNIVWSPLYTAFYGSFLWLSDDAYVATMLHRMTIAIHVNRALGEKDFATHRDDPPEAPLDVAASFAAGGLVGVVVAAVAIMVYGMMTGRTESGSTHHPIT